MYLRNIFANKQNRKKNRLFNSKGFTMPEMLLAAGILAILAAVGVVAATTMLRNSRQAASDKAAESIYTAVQAYLQEVYAFEKNNETLFDKGEDGIYRLKNDGAAQIDASTAGNSGQAVTASVTTNGLVFARKSKGGNGGNVDIVTNYGSVIGPEFYGKGLVIEYNPASCQVYSVFYIDRDDFSYPGETGVRTSADTRKQLYNGYVGYYQGAVQNLSGGFADEMVVKVDNTAKGKSGQLYNYDELKGEIYCKLPEDFVNDKNNIQNGKQVVIEVEVSAGDSGNQAKTIFTAKMEPSVAVINAKRNDGNLFIPVCFDSLYNSNGESRRFKEIFIDKSKDIWDPESGLTNISREDVSGTFQSGEDISVKATVSICQSNANAGNKGTVIAQASDTARDNSLFYYDEKNGDVITSKIAKIYYGRHLQNLDKSSGIESDVSSFEAEQIHDIDFTKKGGKITGKSEQSGKDVLMDDETGRLWNDINYLSFTPITNSKLTSFVGNGSLDESSSQNSTGLFSPKKTVYAAGENEHKIIGLKVDLNGTGQSNFSEAANAGLFGTFSGNEIKNVILVSPKIVGKNGSYSGGLAGEITSAATISDCKLYMRPVYEEDEKDNKNNVVHAKGAQLDVESDKYANDYMTQWLSGGACVGGLVGKTTAGITIDKSFAATIVNADAGGVAGGLVGDAGNNKVTITLSYSDSYIHGQKIGGLIGNCGDVEISDSYSAGFVLGDYNGTTGLGVNKEVVAGAFVPDERFQYGSSTDSNAKIKNSYTLFNFEDITLAAESTNDTDEPNYEAFNNSVAEGRSTAAQTTEVNGVPVPTSSEELDTLIGTTAIRTDDPDNTHVAYRLARYFNSGTGYQRLNEYRRWDNGQFTDLNYPRAGLSHYGDWLPQEIGDFDVDIANTEILAFRIKTAQEPKAGKYKVRIKGMSSNAERTITVTRSKDSDASANNTQSENQSSVSLSDVRASDCLDLHTGTIKDIGFAQEDAAAGSSSEADKPWESSWIVLDKLKDVSKENESWTFKGQFTSSLEGKTDSTGKTANAGDAEKLLFTPGEDIVISWGSKLPDGAADTNGISGIDASKLSETDVIVNSLFSGVKEYSINDAGEIVSEDVQARSGISGSAYDAKIAYGRHLQNLDSTVSGFTPSAITKNIDGNAAEGGSTTFTATQQNDIFFDNIVDQVKDPANQKAHALDIDAIANDLKEKSGNNADLSDDQKAKILAEYKMQWSSVYRDGQTASRPFVPITNSALTTYNGKNKDSQNHEHQTMIVALTEDYNTSNTRATSSDSEWKDAKSVLDSKSTDSANYGLFGTFGASGISNPKLNDIILVSPKIAGVDAGNTGGLAGQISAGSKVEISGCQLYMRPTYGSFFDKYFDETISGYSSENGLDVTGENDAKSYMDKWLAGKNNVGGLVGVSNSDLEIKDSFAATVVNAKDNSGHAGGLVGNASGKKVSVSTSYADCYIHGNKIGGLIGACGNSSTFDDSYSAGFVLGTDGDGVVSNTKAGAFVPDADISAEGSSKKINNSYTLFNFSDITRAEYRNGEAIFDDVQVRYSVSDPILNGLSIPDSDEIDRLDNLTGIGGNNEIHHAYYLAKFFRQAKDTEYDRLKEFARWVVDDDGTGDFGKAYPKAGLPHYGDWLATDSTLTVINGAMLYAHLRMPRSSDAGTMNLKITVDGKDSNEHSVTIRIRDGGKAGKVTDSKVIDPDERKNVHRVVDNNHFVSYYIILDDVTTKNMRFADLFNQANYDKDKDTDNYNEVAYFYPGITIKKVTSLAASQNVTAKDGTVISNNDRYQNYSNKNNSYKNKPSWNSIYGDYSLSNKGVNTTTALVRNFRHLENLDKHISLLKGEGDDGSNTNNTVVLNEARQIVDLTWRDDKTTTELKKDNSTTDKPDEKYQTGVFINDIILLKREWIKDSSNNDDKEQLDWVSVYSGKAYEKDSDSNTNHIYSRYSDVESENSISSSIAYNGSYQPVNLYFNSDNATFTYSASKSDNTTQGSEGCYTIKNLVVSAPKVALTGTSAKANTSSEMEMSPDNYHLDTGVFGFVGVGRPFTAIDSTQSYGSVSATTFSVKDVVIEGEDIENGATAGGLIGRVNVLKDGAESNRQAALSGFTLNIDNVNSTHNDNIDKIGSDTFIYGNILCNTSEKTLYARGYAGGLLGTVNEANLIINDSHVYGKRTFIRNDSNDDVMKAVVKGSGSSSTFGGGSSGGFIGSIQWCNCAIDKTSASTYVYGEQADTTGGFIGRTYGVSGTISHSYVGGHTTNGVYQEGVYRRRYPLQVASNVTGFNASGGFMGYGKGGSNQFEINDCFSAASVYSTWKGSTRTNEYVGGFCAEIGNNVKMTRCYSAGRIYIDSGYAVDKTGLFLGAFREGDKTNNLRYNYVLDGINYQVKNLVGGKDNDAITSNVKLADGKGDTSVTAHLRYSDGLESEWNNAGWNSVSSDGTYNYDSHWDSYDYPFVMPSGNTVYYGDWENPGDGSPEEFDLSWKIVNKDRLSIDFIIPNNNLTRNACWITLAIKGETSGKIYYSPVWIRNYADGNTGETKLMASFVDPKNAFGDPDLVLPDDVFNMNDVLTDSLHQSDSEEDGKTVITFDLDNITKKNGHFAQVLPRLYPGENLDIIVGVGQIQYDTIKTANAASSDSLDEATATSDKNGTPVKLTTNSLFANGTEVKENIKIADSENKAVIRWSRHLQNLDPVVSGINRTGVDNDATQRNGLVFTSAVQTKDVDWNDFLETNSSNYDESKGSDVVIYSFCQKNTTLKDKELANGGNYYGIYNILLKSYTGKLNGTESEAVEIKNISMNSQKELSIGNFNYLAEGREPTLGTAGYNDRGRNGGLFRYVVNDMIVSYLNLTDFSINAEENAGVVVGRTAIFKDGIPKPTITYNNIIIEQKDITTEPNPLRAKNNAGGLLGYAELNVKVKATNITFKGSKKIESTAQSASALVGKMSGGSETTVEFDSILIEGDTVIKSDQSGNNSSGGLVGRINSAYNTFSASNVTINDELSVSSYHDAGGLVGYLADNNSVTITNCNMPGDADGKTLSMEVSSTNNNAGGIAGSIAKTTTLMVDGIIMNDTDLTVNANLAAGGIAGKLGSSGVGIVKVGETDGCKIKVKNGSLVKSTNLKNDNTTSSGGLFGWINCLSEDEISINNTEIKNLSAQGSYTGGVVGRLDDNYNSFNVGSVCTYGAESFAKGSWNTGGFVGYLGEGEVKIDSCSASLYVSANSSRVGGFIGNSSATSGTISKCYVGGHTSTADSGTDNKNSEYKNEIALNENGSSIEVNQGGYNVYGSKSDTSNCIGGFIGYLSSGVKVDRCFTTASVCGANGKVGGFCGSNNGTISNCYAAGAVFKGSNTNNPDVFCANGNVDNTNCFLDIMKTTDAKNGSGVVKKSYLDLVAKDSDPRANNTVRFDSIVIDYPFPFYSTGLNTFYGDWPLNYANEGKYLKITIRFIDTDNSEKTAKIYYYKGKYYEKEENLPAEAKETTP